ncbi:SAM-dependent methyltransferase [Nocardiopsis halotolerans]|uniref:SAM-dependent methyltransferase n=1 Tax=Nocardiopsis halotolerans TaxID=124252 RepID=UPI0003465953
MRDPRANAPIGTSVARTARVWNHWLGGEDDHPVDREVGGTIGEPVPPRHRRPRPLR